MMKTRLQYLLMLGLVVLICFACNEEEPIPAYLYLQPYTLSTNTLQGSNSHKIEDAWVFVNDNLLGVFPLPADVPILESGTNKITIFPGVRENGLRNNAVIQPFFERMEFDHELVPGQTDSIYPSTKIKDNVEVRMAEAFNTSHRFTDDVDGNTNTGISIITAGAKEGSSARIWVTEDDPVVEVASLDVFENIPQNGSDVYLELDYKTDVDLQIGVLGTSDVGIEGTFYKIFLQPKSEWNKIYLNLGEDVTVLGFPGYKVIVRMSFPFSNPNFEGQEVEAFVDNIKLMHFN